MKIAIIYTGGTIGMEKDPISNSLQPRGIEAIQKFVMQEFSKKNISFFSTKTPIDSSDFTKERFSELALMVEQEYHYFDAFLILMGTDTMAYVSSLLSYCTEGLSKPIVFTGGQLPLLSEKSDSKDNLKEAVLGLLNQQFLNEVGIYFHHQWRRAVLSTKVETQNLEAYIAPNPNKREIDLSKMEFKIQKKIEAEFAIFKLNPFNSNNYLKKILELNILDGIVLEVFGAGNLPDFDMELKQLFKEKISKGFRVVIVTQCLRGGIQLGRYASSLVSESLGFANGGKLTTESALAKALYLSTKELNCQQFQAFFEESLRGE
ncbi:asparaginase domain-containing protein [Ochrovirga pacifica]|uniref:asparaginase domain-containing protein n=1 Tax=Ochrovirga pacifica TaxID=1042376 RepID=UPI0002559D94|nr:asparaginase domain-containing protein [Ochrovirga pacifica]